MAFYFTTAGIILGGIALFFAMFSYLKKRKILWLSLSGLSWKWFIVLAERARSWHILRTPTTLCQFSIMQLLYLSPKWILLLYFRNEIEMLQPVGPFTDWGQWFCQTTESYKIYNCQGISLVVNWVHNAVRYLFTSAYVSIISSLLAAYVVSVVYY